MDFEFDLTPDQWETLKALRTPATQQRPPKQFVLEQLAGLGLVSHAGGAPAITPVGRHVLVRGSSRLLDVAA